MIFIFLSAGFFLGWILGRNNLSNLFGAAVGTRMIRLSTAATLACIFLTLGAFTGGAGTTSALIQLAPLQTPVDAAIITVSAALVLLLATANSIPVSIAQTTLGALIGWILFEQAALDMWTVYRIAWAWSISPFLIAGFSFLGMIGIRRLSSRHPMPVLWRDFGTRVGLVVSGCFAAYALGANNISTIAAPYLMTLPAVPPALIWALTCLAVCAGCWTADKNVIRTVTSRLFPLSPIEACVACTTMAVTLLLFSSIALRTFFIQTLHIYVPVIPLPSSILLVGATVGIALAKGGYGLNMMTLLKMVASWILIPVTTGLICYLILTILSVR